MAITCWLSPRLSCLNKELWLKWFFSLASYFFRKRHTNTRFCLIVVYASRQPLLIWRNFSLFVLSVAIYSVVQHLIQSIARELKHVERQHDDDGQNKLLQINDSKENIGFMNNVWEDFYWTEFEVALVTAWRSVLEMQALYKRRENLWFAVVLKQSDEPTTTSEISPETLIIYFFLLTYCIGCRRRRRRIAVLHALCIMNTRSK
jgi:hypothetical protein